jgi:hypothetical protein
VRGWGLTNPWQNASAASAAQENRSANHSGNRGISYSFFSLSLPRISSITFPCSRQMDRRIVSIGQGMAM